MTVATSRCVTPVRLEGKKFILRTIERADLTPRYLAWMNDPEVTRYLESGQDGYTMAQLEEYFDSLDDWTHLLFAIVHKESGLHVGNLSLNQISKTHNRASLGGIIGERGFWGSSGAFVEGMRLLLEHAFKERKFNRIHSGVVIENVPCIVAAIKVGFVQEGVLKSHWRSRDGQYLDIMLYGQVNPYA